ncbi:MULTISPECIES: hypothetical protein [unclassified Caulobacter]|jgi:hypothetical protein|uniref:hypothetical protein n=1 Tax=unclassified Caulobacter TaxID=2648921 RepID=UPI000782C8B2|nr:MULTISPECIES: hypothetical protein [unclassified Caulobacter]AZS21776.1 hypothetical protein CSW63_14695 [Caulobacter sp. FWC26]
MEWIVGIGLVALAVAADLWVKRRRFYRRNMAGLETFSSFGASVTTRGLERLVLGASRIAGLLGALMLFLAAVRALG